MSQQRKPIQAPLDSPFLKCINKPLLRFFNLPRLVRSVDFELWARGVAHAEEVQGPELPPWSPREGVKVAVEEAEAGAIAVQDDEVFLVGLGGASDGEFVDCTVFSREADEGGGAFPWPVGVGFGGGDCGDRRWGWGWGWGRGLLADTRGPLTNACGGWDGEGVEGEEGEDGGLCDGGGSRCPPLCKGFFVGEGEQCAGYPCSML